jgi:hypothetical protein
LTASNTIFFLLTELLLILPYSDPVNKCDTPPVLLALLQRFF